MLQLVLWLGVLFAVVVLSLAIWNARGPGSGESDASELLPDSGGIDEIVLFAVFLLQPVVFLPALPLLLALRRARAGRTRSGVALFGVIAAALMLLVEGVTVGIDVRGSLDCAEGVAPLYLVPFWLLTVFVLASSPSACAAMGLGESRWACGLRRFAHLLLVVAGGTLLVALATSRRPGEAVLDRLSVGETWQAVYPRLAPICSISAYTGHWMLADCRAAGPPALRCVPLPTRRVRLEFDADVRLARWSTSWSIAGMSGSPPHE